ncbi:hypothetical protein ACFL3F_04490 [Planctomycetota bacterium]
MKVLDTQINVTANRAILFEQYKPYFILVVYSAILDGLSTMYFMSHIGPGYESNLFVKHLSYAYGIVAGPIVGKLLQVTAVWIITLFTPALTKMLCAIIMCVNCFAFVVNMNVTV